MGRAAVPKALEMVTPHRFEAWPTFSLYRTRCRSGGWFAHSGGVKSRGDHQRDDLVSSGRAARRNAFSLARRSRLA
jgi:hypothetical protein